MSERWPRLKLGGATVLCTTIYTFSTYFPLFKMKQDVWYTHNIQQEGSVLMFSHWGENTLLRWKYLEKALPTLNVAFNVCCNFNVT